MGNARSNASRIAETMPGAKHVRTQRTQLTDVVKTKKKNLMFLTVRVGLWISLIQGKETVVA